MDMALRQPPADPSVAFVPVDEARYKVELELVDPYHAYASEILRLALLGIAVYGFVLSTGAGSFLRTVAPTGRSRCRATGAAGGDVG
jgi:hypothetical protein